MALTYACLCRCVVPDLPLFGRWRQVRADKVTYTSDLFDEFPKYAVGMIKKGEAYMDNTPQVRFVCCPHFVFCFGFLRACLCKRRQPFQSNPRLVALFGTTVREVAVFSS